ncbi:undecaprenyl-phosphate galactose phosphotransferase WbaP [Desulforamulus ruminis]|uniref:undecaprenyl-phosphate galactose phosphotransferase WbaP n=1 Tax=Desulforamulus ruminis TaxID=1564 RepID=UPI00235536EF|nr:undecaprenyl-phosphate galactose phosphotransferase WbaP [Desulforamulus ruminis]
MSINIQSRKIFDNNIENLKNERKFPAQGIGKHIIDALSVLVILASDFLLISMTLFLAYLTRLHLMSNLKNSFLMVNLEAIVNLWWFPLLAVAVLTYEGMYVKRLPFWDETKHIVKALTWTVIIAVLFMFLSKMSSSISRLIIILTYTYSIFLLPCSRLVIKKALIKAGMWRKNVLILGAGKTTRLIIKGFNREKVMGYRLVGLLEDDWQKIKELIDEKNSVPVLGTFADVEEVLTRIGVRDVIIAAPGMNNDKLVKLTEKIQQISANVIVIPDLFGIPLTGIKVEHLFDEKMLFLSLHNNLASLWNRFLKRLFDIVVSTVIIIITLPLMLIIFIIIKIEDKGDSIFSGYRIGKDGREFVCYKFRTMYVDNERLLKDYLRKNIDAQDQWVKYAKLKGFDPRVTRVGRVLRKLSLDELPQLFNVLKGEMSLVGPRPYLLSEREKMGEGADTILKTAPGITGLWQVSGRNEIDFEGRVHIEAWYVRNWSLWQDITLLIRTVGVVVGRRGAY